MVINGYSCLRSGHFFVCISRGQQATNIHRVRPFEFIRVCEFTRSRLEGSDEKDSD